MDTAFRLLGIGWYVALCILGGGLGGVWLDDRLSLSPLFTLLGLAAGLAAAGIGMYLMLTAVLRDSSDSKGRRKR
jgi:hypothetical protein